jgi:hypothetical protein
MVALLNKRNQGNPRRISASGRVRFGNDHLSEVAFPLARRYHDGRNARFEIDNIARHQTTGQTTQ